jgi:hypothetical protein
LRVKLGTIGLAWAGLPKELEEKIMKRKGITRIELLVVIAAIALLAGVCVTTAGRAKIYDDRVLCVLNLKGIGKAMLLYSQDNDGNFPVAGGPGARWSEFGAINNIGWLKGWPEERTFGAPGKNRATITSCFYLLVRYGLAEPEEFVCDGDEAMVFRLSLFKIAPSSIYETWDFGDGAQVWPGACCSYSYHMPFSFPDPREEGREGTLTNFAINKKSRENSPVCADRNPFLDEHLTDTGPSFGENAYAHKEEGQNVLYKDMRVVFERDALVGISKDNIWTYYDPNTGTDQPPEFIGDEGPPFTTRDSYLVNERQIMPEWWRRRR